MVKKKDEANLIKIALELKEQKRKKEIEKQVLKEEGIDEQTLKEAEKILMERKRKKKKMFDLVFSIVVVIILIFLSILLSKGK